jgi:hypothetical protein
MEQTPWLPWLQKQFPQLQFSSPAVRPLEKGEAVKAVFTGVLDDGRHTKGTISVSDDAIDVEVEEPENEDAFAGALAEAVQQALEPEFVAPTHFDSFAALKTWAGTEFTLEDDESDWFSFTVEWTDAKRSQKMYVRLTESPDETWVVLASVVAKFEQVDAKNLLSRNMQEPVATFALDDEGLIQLVYSFPLEELTDARFVPLANYLAARADDLELELTGADEF